MGGQTGINDGREAPSAAAAAQSGEWAGHAAAGEQTATLLGKTCLGAVRPRTILSSSC